MDCSMPGSLSFINSQSMIKLMSIESVIPSNYLILYHPLLLLPSIFPSIRVFSNKPALCIMWPKYWSFSLRINPTSKNSRLNSFRIDWFDGLAVHPLPSFDGKAGTLKCLLQHHSSKASILWYSAFFTIQLSRPYMTTGKTIALAIWTFVGKVMSLIFNMLSRFVIAFLSRSKCLLISWLQSPSAMVLESQKIVCHCPLFLHLFAMKWWSKMPRSLSFECWVLSQRFNSPLSSSSRDFLVSLRFLP